jgi:hypothetical protein|tara:strand:+ start:529 stop:810 length:282 start_codon:yes stop_codon:yes gene_type:complete
MIIEAILKINPDAKVTVRGTDIDTCDIEWLEDTTPISKDDIKIQIEAMSYISQREKEYPSIQEQLDMQYWDNVNGTTTWQDTIAKVKSDNPKE